MRLITIIIIVIVIDFISHGKEKQKFRCSPKDEKIIGVKLENIIDLCIPE